MPRRQRIIPLDQDGAQPLMGLQMRGDQVERCQLVVAQNDDDVIASEPGGGVRREDRPAISLDDPAQ